MSLDSSPSPPTTAPEPFIVRAERERIAELIHVHRFDFDHGVKQGGPDSFYAGMRYAERLVCGTSHAPHKPTKTLAERYRVCHSGPWGWGWDCPHTEVCGHAYADGCDDYDEALASAEEHEREKHGGA